eukprot:evm.model.scf_466.2 EVM.evm.TU.scf_466.2   scf_466:16249-21643(+)
MVLCAGWGFAPSQAARPTRLPLAAEACRLVPGTDACVPIDAVAADAVRRSRDKELADLYFAVAACSGKTEADTCKADGRCVWDSASCLCSVREIMENLPLCYDLPDPEYSSAASECPSAKSKRQCRQVGPCRWKRGRCHAKPLKKVDAEDKPRVCELQSRIGASHSVECALHATEEECEGTNGTCFWESIEERSVDVKITCPGLMHASNSSGAQDSLPPTVVIPASEGCVGTLSGRLEAIFGEEEVYRHMREAEAACKGKCL